MLLAEADINLEIQNKNAHTVLWMALQACPSSEEYGHDSFAARLLQRGASPNSINAKTGNFIFIM